MVPMPLRIRCREISAADVDGVVNLLTSGFRERTRDFWVCALNRLSRHSNPPGTPKYGYLLECQRRPVGVLLLIWSVIEVGGEQKIRCNVSSWYVEPSFRSYAGMLVSHALKRRHVTYFNITPDPATFPILAAQGYTRYCSGRFLSAPAFSLRQSDARVNLVNSDIYPDADLPLFETDLLRAHADYGCISVTCGAADRRHPFVFLPQRTFGVVPFAYLAYCRRLDEFVHFAGPLGRFLAKRGFPFVVLDANGPIEGLTGKYSDGQPKYFKGPDQPRLGDIAYTERVMFGF